MKKQESKYRHVVDMAESLYSMTLAHIIGSLVSRFSILGEKEKIHYMKAAANILEGISIGYITGNSISDDDREDISHHLGNIIKEISEDVDAFASDYNNECLDFGLKGGD